MRAEIKCTECGMKMGEWNKPEFTAMDFSFVSTSMACDCGSPAVLQEIEDVQEQVEPAIENAEAEPSFAEQYKTELIIGGLAAGAAALAAYFV